MVVNLPCSRITSTPTKDSFYSIITTIQFRVKKTTFYDKAIRKKKSNTRKEFYFLYSTLQPETNFTDFTHVGSLFLGHNDKVLNQKSTIQQI